MIASWSAWSGAAAFGQRFFVNMVPAFGLGLAAMLTILHRSIRWRWLVAGCSCFIIWNGLLVVRYVLGDIPHSGPVPLGVLVVGQFTVLWRHFHRIVQILLIRS